MEYYTKPTREEVKQDVKALIKGLPNIPSFLSLDKTTRYEDNPRSKPYYGYRLYLMDIEAKAVCILYESRLINEDVNRVISLKQDIETLSRVKIRPGWNVKEDSFSFLFEGSTYIGGFTGPLLMPSEF